MVLRRAIAWLWLAVAYQMAGKLDQAYAALAEGQAEDGAARARVASSRGFVEWIAGNLPAIPPLASRFRAVSETHHQNESLGWAHLLLSSVAYQHNDLQAAQTHAKALEELRYLCTPMAYLQSKFISRRSARRAVCRTRRERSLTWQSISCVRPATGILLLAQAFQAELAARQGDLDAAGHWATTIGPYLPLTLMPYYYAPQFTLPKILGRRHTGEPQAGRRRIVPAVCVRHRHPRHLLHY